MCTCKTQMSIYKPQLCKQNSDEYIPKLRCVYTAHLCIQNSFCVYRTQMSIQNSGVYLKLRWVHAKLLCVYKTQLCIQNSIVYTKLIVDTKFILCIKNSNAKYWTSPGWESQLLLANQNSSLDYKGTGHHGSYNHIKSSIHCFKMSPPLTNRCIPL